MAAGGKPGNPTTGFPPFPPSLEIATRFPHSHTRYDFAYNLPGNSKPNLRKVLPMFPDRSVTYVPGRTYKVLVNPKSNGPVPTSPASRDRRTRSARRKF